MHDLALDPYVNPFLLLVKKMIRRYRNEGYNLDQAEAVCGFAFVYFADRAEIMYNKPFAPYKINDELKNIVIGTSIILARTYLEKLADINAKRLLSKQEIITCIDLALSDATLIVYDEESVKPKEGWAYPSNIRIANEASRRAAIYLDLM